MCRQQSNNIEFIFSVHQKDFSDNVISMKLRKKTTKLIPNFCVASWKCCKITYIQWKFHRSFVKMPQNCFIHKKISMKWPQNYFLHKEKTPWSFMKRPQNYFLYKKNLCEMAAKLLFTQGKTPRSFMKRPQN